MAKVYITSKDLIKTLIITDQNLIDIETFFDADADDEWELLEGKDYKVVIASTGLREYTESGAYAIARYLEATKKPGFWDLLNEWIFHTKAKIRQSFIRRKILENSSSLVKRNDRFWISRSDAVAIFGTRSDYLTKMADHTQKTKFSLIEGQDSENFIDDGLYFSLEGIAKLAQAFHECQTKKNRKEECREVGEVIKPQVEDIVEQIRKREKRIASAMEKAKRRDRSTCRLTGQRNNRVNQLKLSAHHLYSQNEYPLLADMEDNLITLACEVHDQFHINHMGGCQKPCTIDNFIDFVQRYYPDQTDTLNWLGYQQKRLGKQEPVSKRKPHVLYLPFSKVS